MGGGAVLFDIAPAADEIVQGCGCTSYLGEWADPGCPSGHNHTGVDLGSIRGGWAIFRSPIYASRSGVVVVVGMPYLGPDAVGIAGDDGRFYGYGHLDEAVVVVGQWVAAGQLIGYMGTRGASEAPHLHFLVRLDGCWDGPPFAEVCDPIPFLSFPAPDPGPGQVKPKRRDAVDLYVLEQKGRRVMQLPGVPWTAGDRTYVNLAAIDEGTSVLVYYSAQDGRSFFAGERVVLPGNVPDVSAPPVVVIPATPSQPLPDGAITIRVVLEGSGAVSAWPHREPAP